MVDITGDLYGTGGGLEQFGALQQNGDSYDL